MQPVLDLDNLHVRLAGRPVLCGLSARLAGGGLGLLGPNGAGKSTLMRTLLGFHRPAEGHCRVLGMDVATQGPAVRAEIGYMPEGDAFIAGMTAVRFVRYMAELHGLPPAEAIERAHEALLWVGLGEARYRRLETFSTGMRQRVRLAQAVVHGPRLVLLDEPTSGLDPGGRGHVLRLVRELVDSGMHVLVSSHLLRDVEACADQVIILKAGRIARTCDLARERAADRRVLEVEATGDEGRLLAEIEALGCEHARSARGRLLVALPDGRTAGDVLAAAERAGVALRRMVPRRDSLEDLFLQAMESGDGATEIAHGGA